MIELFISFACFVLFYRSVDPSNRYLLTTVPAVLYWGYTILFELLLIYNNPQLHGYEKLLVLIKSVIFNKNHAIALQLITCIESISRIFNYPKVLNDFSFLVDLSFAYSLISFSEYSRPLKFFIILGTAVSFYAVQEENSQAKTEFFMIFLVEAPLVYLFVSYDIDICLGIICYYFIYPLFSVFFLFLLQFGCYVYTHNNIYHGINVFLNPRVLCIRYFVGTQMTLVFIPLAVWLFSKMFFGITPYIAAHLILLFSYALSLHLTEYMSETYFAALVSNVSSVFFSLVLIFYSSGFMSFSD